MKKFGATLITLLCFMTAFSQVENELIEDKFDEIAGEWLEKSGQLKTYQGVNEYCLSPEYRKSVNETLRLVHHYDSLILKDIKDPTTYMSSNAKEEKKTLKHLQELEDAYSVENFIEQMRSTCLFRNDIERESDKIKNSVAEESYDGKILILETELRNYLVKIDRLVLRIDDHLHLLHINKKSQD